MENTNIPKPAPLNTQETGTKTQPPKSKFKVYFFFLLVACIGIVIAKLSFDFFTRKIKAQPGSADKKSQGLSRLITILPRKSEGSSSSPLSLTNKEPLGAIKKRLQHTVTPYVLNGVFFSDDKGYALINNEIVEEGNIIDAATVVKINTDGVELKIKDKTVRLSIQGN
jgi:hypothetical protein